MAFVRKGKGDKSTSKLSYGRITSRDLVAISISLGKMPEIKQLLLRSKNEFLFEIVNDLDSLNLMKMKLFIKFRILFFLLGLYLIQLYHE